MNVARRKSTKPYAKPRRQKIRIKGRTGLYEFGGWLADRGSYLRVQRVGDNRCDWIEGAALYRLAKAIVRRFEATR